MSRRSSRKVSHLPSYEEEDDATVTATEVVIKATKSPKRGRKSVLEEQILVNEQEVTATDSKTAKHVQVEKAGSVINVNKSPTKSKVKAETIEIENETILQSAPETKTVGNTKRKAKVEDPPNEDRENKKVTKKRKTKEDKDAESMPLATRTPVSALKKAMYIGAHVSAAGGELPYQKIVIYHLLILYSPRCP